VIRAFVLLRITWRGRESTHVGVVPQTRARPTGTRPASMSRPSACSTASTCPIRATFFPNWRSCHSLSPSGPSCSPHSRKPSVRKAVAGLRVSESSVGCHDTASQRTNGESLSPGDPPTTLGGCGLAYPQRDEPAAVPPTAREVQILARNDGVSPSTAYNARSSVQQLRLLLAARARRPEDIRVERLQGRRSSLPCSARTFSSKSEPS
jgi:hypothetical protein